MGSGARMLFLLCLIAIGLLLSGASYRPPEVKATFSAVNVNLTATISGNATPPVPTDNGTVTKGGGGGGGGGLPPAPSENVTNVTNVTMPPEEMPPEEGTVPGEQPKENITGGVQRPKAAPLPIMPVVGTSIVGVSVLSYLLFIAWKRKKRKKGAARKKKIKKEIAKKGKVKKGLNR